MAGKEEMMITVLGIGLCLWVQYLLIMAVYDASDYYLYLRQRRARK